MLIDKEFFSGNSVSVAKKLLGKMISINGKKGRIVETEAYRKDRASHAFKRTPRSELMYSSYGKVYVYMIYGNYFCLNFTTEKNNAGAVLIRAVEPINFSKDCSGPGKFCREFGIDKRFNGSEINDRIKIHDCNGTYEIIKAKRIGIKKDKDLLWRFYIKENKPEQKIRKF